MTPMPRHLRNVVGLMGFAILSRLVFLAMSFPRNVQMSSVAGNLIAIAITLGLIRGFAARSSPAWLLAKILNGLSLVGGCIMTLLLLAIPSNSPIKWPAIWYGMIVGVELYTLWVLFSSDARSYFMGTAMTSESIREHRKP